MELFNGKVALVTGAGKGIGAAISRMLAQEGCRLMLMARTDSDLQALRAEIQALVGGDAEISTFVGSVAKAQDVEAVVNQTVDTFGRIDILVNNAGIAPKFALLQELSVAELDATIDTNLKGPLYTLKYVIPHMVNQGSGFVININSIAGKTAYPFSSVYCASKFGLTALTEGVAGEQRSNNIKVVGIYPGEVNTPIWDTIEPGVKQDLNQMLDPTDIAEAVRYVLLQPAKALVKDVTVVPMRPGVTQQLMASEPVVLTTE